MTVYLTSRQAAVVGRRLIKQGATGFYVVDWGWGHSRVIGDLDPAVNRLGQESRTITIETIEQAQQQTGYPKR